MDKFDKQAVTVAIGVLAAAFEKQLSGRMVAAYADGLADLPGEQVVLACRQIMRTAKYFPRISEIREEANRLSHDNAAEQWALLLSRGIDAVNATTRAVIKQMGGMNYLLRMCREEDLHRWESKRFRELYPDQQRREQVRHQLEIEGRAPRVLQGKGEQAVAKMVNSVAGRLSVGGS